ncbi:MAG: hypothetical protein KDD44_01985 [Bdellovibrionales bacterium]|nr:hypothetical protein [Bdellovibrionales bacterium]
MTATTVLPHDKETARWKRVTTPRRTRRATLANVRRIAEAYGFDPESVIDVGGRYLIPRATITPEINLALRAGRSPRARRISRTLVGQHALTMAEGWVFNPTAPVLIDTEGRAVGAGHRIEAAAHARAIIELPVEFDVDDSVLRYTDRNKQPTIAELLAYDEQSYADDPRFVQLTLAGIAGYQRRPQMTVDEASQYVSQNYDALLWLLPILEDCLAKLDRVSVPKVTINSVLASFAMAWHYVTPSVLRSTLAPAFRALVLGEARGGKSGKHAAMLYLRERLEEGGLTSGQAFGLTAGAIQMELDGRRPRRAADIVIPAENPFPWFSDDESDV